ncbi:TetR/AcrR family transcriptional regulator [Acuticoccus sediminis]|uniref:TetR/AcrR family transcriptional regulator n=1 Tax=Acuticoccus sediminis TaxID=2184697 RepID=UPI001CFCB15A|nr:TetR/AcrR family transcriptional regulator [Acuticoccus sediminis]
MPAQDTREQIVEAADRLFYEQGFDTTSFADIASVVGLSRGNFYYHFKTKDEILDAVIERRLAVTRAMLNAWQAGAETPKARIMSFVRILIANRAKIMSHGCPVGTLSSELAKLDHASRDKATAVFTLFRDFLRRQFAELGEPDADGLALHVLMRSQGVAALATAFRDEAFVAREVAGMERWLDTRCPDTPRN